MSYVLKKGNSYCWINKNNKINKVGQMKKATKFSDVQSAYSLLNRACKKLKGYKIVECHDDKVNINCNVNTVKNKRKIFSPQERIKIYNKYKGRCAICGEFVPYDLYTIDHIIPISKGGSNNIDNLQCTCKTCNFIKQDILPDDLMKKLYAIILYQMKKEFSPSFWRRINKIRNDKYRMNRKKILKNMIKKIRKKSRLPV